MKLIGVTGKAGAGKTTFANYFEKKSNIGVIHVDDIMNEFKKRRFSLFMKDDKHGEKTEIKSGLKFFIYNNKFLYNALMKIRALMLKNEIKSRIDGFKAEGKDFVFVDDVYLSYLTNYKDFDKVYYIRRPYFTRLDAIKKRDECDKRTLVASEIAFKKKNYNVNLIDPRIEIVDNEYGSLEEYEAFLEQEYDQKYKQYNFDDWIKVDVKSKSQKHQVIGNKAKKIQRRTDIDIEKV